MMERAAQTPLLGHQLEAYSIDWDPGLRSSGVYYVRLTTDSGRSAGTRWVLMR